MSTLMKILRSITPATRPTGQTYGVPYVNFGDNQFGVHDQGNNPRDLIGVPVFSSAAAYTAGQAVSYLGVAYIALVSVSAGAFNPAQWSAIAAQSSLSGSRDLVATLNMAGVANVNTPNGIFTTAYEYYEIIGEVSGASGIGRLITQISVDNAASFFQGASDYLEWGTVSLWNGSTATASGYGILQSGLDCSYAAFTGAAALAVFHMRVYKPAIAGALQRVFMWNIHHQYSGGWANAFYSGTCVSSTAPITNLKFLTTGAGGNLSAGSAIKIYGVK